MLSISDNKVNIDITTTTYKSVELVNSKKHNRVLIKILFVFLLLSIVAMFLPWTQIVRAKGNVTTLKPEQRPQTIHSIIAGRIEKWHVREGDYVNKGDTIIFISEVKDDFFDPNLIDRTSQQLKAKELSVSAYMEKAKAIDSQVVALLQTQQFKFRQLENKLLQAQLKITADSIDLEAAKINFNIATEQLRRMEEMHTQGLKSLTDLETRRLQNQKAQAAFISQESKLLSSRNEYINVQIELSSILAEFRDKIAKAESEKFSALSSMYDAEATVIKLQNQFTNFSVRSGMYYITAPQNGFITKAIQSGIGETIKEGAEIVSIMPSVYDLAVEMYIKPVDLPLMKIGKHVRIQFDGWPAVVFSGWPNLSYGTFGGLVVAIDNFTSSNGNYRVMVAQDPNDFPWPEPIRPGAGANSMALLNEVPIWYELWRQINGFPPDYYVVPETNLKF
jgi:adhesin transport system membrane fusion protein